MSDYILGLDIGGTKSTAIIGTTDGDVVARKPFPSDAHRGVDAMIADLLAAADELVSAKPVASVGVSIGGPMNMHEGIILSPPHLPGWDNIPLKKMLEQHFGVPAFVVHDAAACLLAEWKWGAAKGSDYCAYLTMGTGFGAGLMIDGRIVAGPKGQTPEIGHITIADDGPIVYGKAGCAESFCSGTGLAKLAHFMFPQKFPQPVPAKELSQLAKSGDAQAAAVLEKSAKMIGRACATLTDIFAMETIVLGSLARYLGNEWVQIIRDEFYTEALPANSNDTKIVVSALGDKLQDLSAIAAVNNKMV